MSTAKSQTTSVDPDRLTDQLARLFEQHHQSEVQTAISEVTQQLSSQDLSVDSSSAADVKTAFETVLDEFDASQDTTEIVIQISRDAILETAATAVEEGYKTDLVPAFRTQFQTLEAAVPEAITKAAEQLDITYELDPEEVQKYLDSEHRLVIEGLQPRQVRDIDQLDIGNLVAVRGTVKRTTQPKPIPVELAFRCQRCETVTRVPQHGDSIQEPAQCRACDRDGPFVVESGQSSYEFEQQIEIQESPDELRGGTEPMTIRVRAGGGLVHTVSPGDSVTVTGIVEHESIDASSGRSFEQYINARGIEVHNASEGLTELTQDERERIQEIVHDQDPIEAVVDSIAPSVYGHEDVKFAIALQMFQGVPKTFNDDNKRIRGDIHVCLLGDPATAKSEMLDFVTGIMPRSASASAESASKVGLTAAAVQDSFGDGGWTVEGGTLVMADQGIATVDEIGRLDEDVNALRTALEQQKVQVAKAGINTELNARCGVLASGNPKYDRWQEEVAVSEQIDIPPAVLSRFDLIFTLKDRPDEARDTRVADQVLYTNYKGDGEGGDLGTTDATPPIDVADDVEVEPEIAAPLLTKYIEYARHTVYPRLTAESWKAIREFYVSIRQQSEGTDHIPLTARKLSALLRLSEASARIRLSDTIATADVERAIEIVKKSLRQVGYDSEADEYDADIVEAGQSATQRQRMREVREVIKELEENDDQDGCIEIDTIKQVSSQDDDKIERELDKLKRQGKIYEKETDCVNLIE